MTYDSWMDTPNVVRGSPNYSTLAQVAAHNRVSPERVRADLRARKFTADRPGTEYLFTLKQWEDAETYYAERRRALQLEAERYA